MDGPDSVHNLNLEWGCITNLADRIVTIEDSIEGGWVELADMVVDAMMEEGAKKDPVTAFFHLYDFLFRLFYRLKVNPTPRKFNIISEHTILNEKFYWITNYDYHTFIWAIQNGFIDGLSNDYIQVPVNKLSDKQKRVFMRKLTKQ